MLDRNYILENQKELKENIKSRNLDIDLNEFIKLDEDRVKLMVEVEDLRKQRNENAKKMKSDGKDDAIRVGKEIKEKLSKLEPKLDELEQQYRDLSYKLPNKLASDTPIGKDESENIVVRKFKEPTQFSFTPKEHWQLGEELGVIDIKTACEVTGARFVYLKGDLALLEFALVQHVFSTLQDKELLIKTAKDNNIDINVTTFTPIIPPVLIKPEIMHKMGRLEPRIERYHMQEDDLYLVGSAEHTMGPMHMDTVFQELDLPKRYIGFSTAFRREAGSYGKDLKGILRVHQFDKLEFETFCLAETSVAEQDFLVALQEYFMQSIGVPYRIVRKCTGDMGLPDYREFDVEAWLPGQNKYRGTHTSDLMTDYQSRRLNVKVKRADNRVEYVHMNDATAFAIGRTLIAIMENYQREDGSVVIPEVLRKYIGNRDRIVKK